MLGYGLYRFTRTKANTFNSNETASLIDDIKTIKKGDRLNGMIAFETFLDMFRVIKKHSKQKVE